jgi:RNA polymerase sigma-70 factor (ECF subfamily)
MFRIAHNTAFDHLRRRAVPLEPLPASDTAGDCDPSPADRLEQADLKRALDAALAQLRPEYRTAILLRYREGLGYEEIAEALDLPQGTAKTFVHRARKALAADPRLQAWSRPPND